MRLLLTTILALSTTAAFAAPVWVVSPAASKLTWSVPFNQQPVSGEFEKWDAKIAFDAEDLATSIITVTVQLGSVNSKDANRDGTLKGAEFFNVATTPTATFTSTKITKTAQGYLADGSLSLAGVTKPLQLPFTLNITGDKATAVAKVMLNRTQFGVGKGQWASAKEIGESVEVTATINATRATPKAK